MLLDQNAVLSDGQKITASGASANMIDNGAAGNAVAGALFVVCRSDETFAGVTNLEVALQTSDTAAFTSFSALAKASFAAADLTAGKLLLAAPVSLGMKRYLRAYYTVTGTGTAGKLSCFLTDAVEVK